MNSLIARLTRAGLHKPWRFLFAALAITVVSVWLASGLQVRSSFEELLPSDVPSVRNVKELVRRVGGDGTVLVSIESKDGRAGLGQAKAIAPTLAREILTLGPDTIRSVEVNLKPVEGYYQTHWPLFLSVEELTTARDTLNAEIAKAKRRSIQSSLDLGLGDVDEKPDAGVVDGGPFADAPGAGLAGESATAAPTDGGNPWLDASQPLPREQIAKRFARYDDGFLVHPDGKSLAIVVRPSGTALGVGESRALIDRIHAIIDRHQAELDAAHLRVGLGGTFPLFVVEYEAVLHDIASTAMLCVTLVLLVLFLYFRDLRSTLSLGTAILVAVAVTFGITRMVIGYLNTQTAFLGSIVIGNGINYGLIYLARVRQLRRSGVGLETAALEGARTAAHATLLASAATSVSFAMLILAANRGFRHFGFIGGVGMLLCWFSTFTLLPALLAIWERIRPVKPARVPPPEHPAAPAWMHAFFARPWWIIAIFATLVVASLAIFVRLLPTVIERNVENLTNEPQGSEELRRDNLRANEALGRSSSGAIALLPSREAADAFCKVVRERMKEPRYAEVVDGCDTISSVVPAAQGQKLALVREIHDRLNDAVLGSLSATEAAKLREIKLELGTQAPVTEAMAPPTLLDRFRERDGSLGRLAVVTARADAKLEHGPRLQAFADAVRNVPVGDQKYDATGENVIFADLLKNIEHEGPLTSFGSLLGVCVLVAIFLRQWRISLEVLGALVAGVVLMGGAASVLHLKINFFNFIVFPITFGIAVDYGANVAVRIQDRKGDVLGALREVGPAVALCSCTSMIGYGSLIIALNRALQSFGHYALVGEVTTIVAALVLLPAMALIVNPARK